MYAIRSYYGSFEHFIFDDEIQDICWHLVENKSVLTTKQQTVSLFDNVDATIYLVPEFKKADYILKIDNTDSFFDSDIVLKQLSQIKFITMAYTVITSYSIHYTKLYEGCCPRFTKS